MGKPGRPKKYPKGGQPEGARNALSHGVHSYLCTGRLPKGASYIGRLVKQFRTAVEAAILEAHGEVSIRHAALAQSASRHEAVCCLLQRWLRESEDKLSIPERAGLLKQFSTATDRRDACLKELELDAASDPWKAIYADALEVETKPPNRDEHATNTPVDSPEADSQENAVNADSRIVEGNADGV